LPVQVHPETVTSALETTAPKDVCACTGMDAVPTRLADDVADDNEADMSEAVFELAGVVHTPEEDHAMQAAMQDMRGEIEDEDEDDDEE